MTTKGLIKRINPELYEDEGYLIAGQDGYINKTIERITVDESVTETVLKEDEQEAIYDIEVVGTKAIVTKKLKF